MIDLILGDCLEKLRELPADSVDSIVTDPPYGLSFMGKHWDRGVPGVDFWVEMIRVLKPGGYLLSFSGTRTYHRMGCAIEDGGFEIRDMIEWVYGSGFPKSLNIGKAVDKMQGNERSSEVVKGKVFTGSNNNINGEAGEYEVTKGTSEWEGWGTALKPAHEPICMARKPLSEKTVAANVLKYGTGGINIDESRVETSDKYSYPNGAGGNGFHGGVGREPDGSRTDATESNTLGRFPANLIHDNSEEVRECFPETGNRIDNRASCKSGDTAIWGDKNKVESTRPQDNGGNASRFFKSIIYQAKASKAGRGEGNNHPTVKPVALMEYLINMVTKEGGTVLDPFMGSGTTGVACKNLNRDFIGIELNPEYFKFAESRINASGESLGMEKVNEGQMNLF